MRGMREVDEGRAQETRVRGGEGRGRVDEVEGRSISQEIKNRALGGIRTDRCSSIEPTS